ncbi:MAG: hypothetical protein K8F91_24490 [Candidatus Obscuribacterales bacterium]|nr:hypothetical protein [Candidatus Obscuribacterales bacterium]
MMSRLKKLVNAVRALPLIKSFLKNKEKFGCQHVTSEPHHHWQSDLDHIATRTGEQPVKMRIEQEIRQQASEENREVEDNFKKLFSDIKEEAKAKAERGDPLSKGRKRTNGDETAVDLKAWWGQSVATWDPIDSKNVYSARDQKSRRRAKWFS